MKPFLLPNAGDPRKPHHRPQLQDVLLPVDGEVELAELLRELRASLDVLRADEVGRGLDAVGEVANLGQS